MESKKEQIEKIISDRIDYFKKINHGYEAQQLGECLIQIKALIPPENFNLSQPKEVNDEIDLRVSESSLAKEREDKEIDLDELRKEFKKRFFTPHTPTETERRMTLVFDLWIEKLSHLQKPTVKESECEHAFETLGTRAVKCTKCKIIKESNN